MPSTAAHSPVARVLAGLDEIETLQEGVYRTLHEHPELPFAEVRTAGTAAGALRDAGFEVQEKIGRTGVVGALKNGHVPMRADLDAFDAAGLALFAVSGALKAFAFGLNPLAAVVLGMLTGIGGGILRDLLVSEIPTVLRADLYAVAALAGASVAVIGGILRLPAAPVALAGAALCFGLRLVALRRGWALPVATENDDEAVLRWPSRPGRPHWTRRGAGSGDATAPAPERGYAAADPSDESPAGDREVDRS